MVKISIKYIPKGPINDIPSLVQIMAWRRSGDKPLSEPMAFLDYWRIYAPLGLNELICFPTLLSWEIQCSFFARSFHLRMRWTIVYSNRGIHTCTSVHCMLCDKLKPNRDAHLWGRFQGTLRELVWITLTKHCPFTCRHLWIKTTALANAFNVHHGGDAVIPSCLATCLMVPNCQSERDGRYYGDCCHEICKMVPWT